MDGWVGRWNKRLRLLIVKRGSRRLLAFSILRRFRLAALHCGGCFACFVLFPTGWLVEWHGGRFGRFGSIIEEEVGRSKVVGRAEVHK